MCDPSRWPIFKRLQVAYFERPLTHSPSDSSLEPSQTDVDDKEGINLFCKMYGQTFKGEPNWTPSKEKDQGQVNEIVKWLIAWFNKVKKNNKEIKGQVELRDIIGLFLTGAIAYETKQELPNPIHLGNLTKESIFRKEHFSNWLKENALFIHGNLHNKSYRTPWKIERHKTL